MESEATVCGDNAAIIPLNLSRNILTDVSPRLNSVLQERYLGKNSLYPARSCREIKQSNNNSLSDFYWIQTETQPELIWCNMELQCGSEPSPSGWTRIAFVNVSDEETNCPGENVFKLVTTPVRYCKRNMGDPGCSSHSFSTKGLSYDGVCGRITGVQIGTTDVFAWDQEIRNDINQPYVDGASLTHGAPRQHIWTFASFISEYYNECPCSINSTRGTPQFVGEDYFCESGANTTNVTGTSIFYDDLLWDGESCNEEEVGCCDNAPWFYKSLDITAGGDDIEFRLCADQSVNDEQTAFTLIEIYIQ